MLLILLFLEGFPVVTVIEPKSTLMRRLYEGNALLEVKGNLPVSEVLILERGCIFGKPNSQVKVLHWVGWGGGVGVQTQIWKLTPSLPPPPPTSIMEWNADFWQEISSVSWEHNRRSSKYIFSWIALAYVSCVSIKHIFPVEIKALPPLKPTFCGPNL